MSMGGDGYEGRASGDSGDTRHTRTRLPEDEDYGTRPPVRPGRSLVTVVGVVVLLIAAIAFANSSDGGGGEGKKGSDAKPTDPSGQKPVSNPHTKVASGFPRSEKGAESAAVNYSVVLGSADMFDGKKRPGIIDSVYTPSALRSQKKEIDEVYSDPDFLKRIGLDADGNPPAGSDFISRVNPVGTDVEEYSGGRATVAVWYSSLFGIAGEDSKTPVSESWYTTTYEMRWSGGAWKVHKFSQKDGPAPVGRDQKASSAKEMAEAVKKFGGFTYAR
ncbi:hypothetical protein [Streptomyces sp. NPDC005438]|uniref:hypothetical protein n=1 Tax=Streptomyces sp. NPDC005438 TaxID=3156880 RepID=UPI0033B969E7